MKYAVLSRRQVEDQEYFYRRFQDNCEYVLISCWAQTEPPILHATTNCAGSLQLNFEDFGKEGAGLIKEYYNKNVFMPIFQYRHARQILELVNKNILEINTIITQCEGGVSRSVAIANALSMILDGKLYRDKYYNTELDWEYLNWIGNEYVYDKILREYNHNTGSYLNIKKYIEQKHKEFIKYRR